MFPESSIEMWRMLLGLPSLEIKDLEEKKVEKKELLKVGTKVIVTNLTDKAEYKGEIKKADKGLTSFPYLVDCEFRGREFWFRRDYTSCVPLTFRVAEEKPTFKVGDKVRLKEKFYDEADFKGDDKHQRKEIAKLKGRAWTVNSVDFNPVWKQMRVSGDSKCPYTVPLSLLELVETPVVEVKRRAKVEEYIKIVDAHPTRGQFYRHGDILQIQHFGCASGLAQFPKGCCIEDSEYVVLENYVPKETPLRKWTDAEIMEAKLIIAEIYAVSAYKMVCSHGWDKSENAYLCVVGYCGKTFEAKCCPTDEPNTYIGLMVALCKATRRKLPSWIRKDGTK
jgi:hypothetical protein